MDFELAPGTVVGGDFRVTAPLARGGMGAVYVAEQISTARPRALKVLSRDVLSTPGAVERFEIESRVAARIRSDHVVEVIAAGLDPALGLPWLAMELLEGRSLDAIVREVGALSRAEAGEILRQVGAGLAAAHQAGVVHRDLKPENVFVSMQRDASRAMRVKILDFGIAKIVAEASAASASTLAVGTPRWMAPEQTDSSGVSPPTDVWAFGLLAYHAITGRYFWNAATSGTGSTISQLLREILTDPIPRASARAAEQGLASPLPPGFDAWLAQCLERDPRGRFSHGAAASAALAAVLGSGPIEVARLIGAGGGVPSPYSRTMPAAIAPTVGNSTAPPVVSAPRARDRRPVLAVGAFTVLVGAAAALGHVRFDLFGVAERARPAPSIAAATPAASPAPAVPSSPPVAPFSLDGIWEIRQGVLPDGTAYTGQITISSVGEAKRMIWALKGDTGVSHGIALVDRDHLDAAWGVSPPYALLVYRIREGTLDGRFVEIAAPLKVHTEKLTGPAKLEGTYQVAEASEGYVGSVTFSKLGERVLMERDTTAGHSHGVGLRDGDRLVIAVSPDKSAGTATYEIEPAGTLRGVWTGGEKVAGSGRELLVRAPGSPPPPAASR